MAFLSDNVTSLDQFTAIVSDQQNSTSINDTNIRFATPVNTNMDGPSTQNLFRPSPTILKTSFKNGLDEYRNQGDQLNRKHRIKDGVNHLTEVATLQKFMQKLENIGISVKNRYYLTFSGIPDYSFLVTDITVPNVKMNVGEIKFDGRAVELPVNDEYGHDFTMTVWADVAGVAYFRFREFILKEFRNTKRYAFDDSYMIDHNYLPSSGHTIRLEQLADYSTYYGLKLTYKDVRIKEISSLSFGEGQNELQQFDLTCTAVSYDVEKSDEIESYDWM